MDIKEEIKAWQENVCVETMRKKGLEAGSTVVDYGCGIGNYTFPISMTVGEAGTVYAVDVDRYTLEKIRIKAKKMNIHNIYPMEPGPACRLELADSSADGFMIYDLIHSLTANGGREEVLSEARRVLKNGAVLSILPFHMAGNRIKELIHVIEAQRFELYDVQKAAGIHFEMHRYLNRKSERLKDYERGDIYNFKKLAGKGEG
ncbi:MAG: class I SAM-dependent methyltransferase [Clostridium sp.]|nr:class I SAM-dependent methyltransferase [Clostridium sp.]